MHPRLYFANRLFGAALFAALAALSLGACGDTALLAPEAGMGPHPVLPPPVVGLIPTVNIAPAQGWPEGVMPTPMPGLAVTPFATGLAHPRWFMCCPTATCWWLKPMRRPSRKMAKASKAGS